MGCTASLEGGSAHPIHSVAVRWQPVSCMLMCGCIHRNARYQLRLGRSLWSQGGSKRKESLKIFIKTCKLDPGCNLAFTYLGHHYASTASTAERAMRCYEKAVLLEPLDSEAGEALFQFYANADKPDKVVKLCQRVTDAAFGPFMRLVKWAWLGLGRALLSQGKVGLAVDACQAAARAAPENPDAWQVLGDAYQARGSYVAAVNAYGKVIELDPATVAARFQMATVNGILGNVNDAIDQFEEVVKLQPKYLPAHVGLADACIASAAAQLAEGVHGSAVVGTARQYTTGVVCVCVCVCVNSRRPADVNTCAPFRIPNFDVITSLRHPGGSVCIGGRNCNQRRLLFRVEAGR